MSSHIRRESSFNFVGKKATGSDECCSMCARIVASLWSVLNLQFSSPYVVENARSSLGVANNLALRLRLQSRTESSRERSEGSICGQVGLDYFYWPSYYPSSAGSYRKLSLELSELTHSPSLTFRIPIFNCPLGQ
jgi:hypothetical protein